MKNKLALKFFLWSLGVSMICMLTLAAHVFISIDAKAEQNAFKWHLTRIEFDEAPLDSLKAVEAINVINSIPEVKRSVINRKKGTLVYGVEVGSLKSAEVFQTFMTKGDFKASRFIPKKESIDAESCPAIDKKSIVYQFGEFFQTSFNKINN